MSRWVYFFLRAFVI